MSELEKLEWENACDEFNRHRKKSIEHILQAAQAMKHLKDTAPPNPKGGWDALHANS